MQMQIGELADRVGVNTKTIRYYESIELLPPPDRTPAGYRIYGPDDETRLTFIKTAQHLGLSLDEIREILALRGAGAAPCEHVRGVLRQQVRDISRRIADLRRLRRELQSLDAAIDDIPRDAASVCRIIEHVRSHHQEEAATPAGPSRGGPVRRPLAPSQQPPLDAASGR
jgi:DNA-binding transcriptional MerR regulator